MESFQGRAPPTGWNDLPANLSPNLKFGGGSSRTKRINRNNLYQQYYNNNNLYSSYSASGSQEYGLNQQNSMGSQNSFANPNAPPPMMSQSSVAPPPMMGSQNNLNQQNPVQPPPMMGNMQQQQTSAQTPSVNYFNPASSIPAPTFNNQFNNINTYQSNNYTNQPSTNYNNSNNSLNAAATLTTNISNDKKTYIMSVYNKHLDTYNASCSLFQRKIYEDSRQRINTMYEQLNSNMIDEQTVGILEAIANALETKDSNTASTNVSYLMKNSNEMKWVLGVKELVDFICSN
ncbi:hypothetical protein BCR32DRAFT_277701 [Anaeromyces robustus]|jgi:hypothetical protein|uniref:SRA1/Sec31 domain-containing protein n=1 Tax=Anaeromyces robustus TaxID=1754192 RepID=A0A1Y1XDI5_9FUNG|nr:hypothetical protein BCR32DRAFT_277701 [Anaeromyces robustus]|eukprot:ORX83785.1 hypothetical protein BCR32DRAFT_277701 [Anaeromyces robustus]